MAHSKPIEPCSPSLQLKAEWKKEKHKIGVWLFFRGGDRIIFLFFFFWLASSPWRKKKCTLPFLLWSSIDFFFLFFYFKEQDSSFLTHSSSESHESIVTLQLSTLFKIRWAQPQIRILSTVGEAPAGAIPGRSIERPWAPQNQLKLALPLV